MALGTAAHQPPDRGEQRPPAVAAPGREPSAALADSLARLSPWWVLAGVVAALGALSVAVLNGPVGIRPAAAVRELLGLDSGLGATESAILWQLRLPRAVLGLLVGATLAVCGAAYQGVFRNPLADPYLLGAAAGAGLGVTVVIAGLGGPSALPLSAPLAAFVGALIAVALTYALGAAGGPRASTASLILAGVAVTSFLTAIQTYLQQRSHDTIQQVYAWILGRLTTSGWHEVLVVLPYAVVTFAVLLAYRRILDVLAVGDDEAATLGINARRTRLLVVVAASLGTAAAVSVSGLIGFVGIIVPHTLRLLAGGSHRVLLPLSVLFGAAFLALTDLLARTVALPAEVPIGVVTAFFGAPFFVLVLRTTRGRGVP